MGRLAQSCALHGQCHRPAFVPQQRLQRLTRKRCRRRRCRPAAATPETQTLPEIAKSLPSLEDVTKTQVNEIGSFWDSVTAAIPWLKDRPELSQLALPSWVSSHPAALLTVRLSGSILVSFLAIKVLDWMASRAGETEKERKQAQRGALPPLMAAARLTVLAVHPPLRLFLVVHAFLHASSVLFNFVRVYYTPKADSWPASVVHMLSKGFRGGDILADKVFQVLTVIFVSWVGLRLKDRWVQRLLDERAKSPRSDRALSREIDQVLLPLSSIISWVIVITSSGVSMNLLGINLLPLATAGLGSGVVLGFASQSVLANVIAGCNLLITRPVVVGDRVTLQGKAEVVGVVERVDFTRTIIRDDWNIPVSVPNKVLTDCVIWNESRTEMNPVREHYGGPRQLKLRVRLRSADLHLASDLTKALKRHLITECDGVDVMLPVYCAVQSALEDHSFTIIIQISSTAMAARSWMSFRQRVILDIGRIVAASGAQPAYNLYGHVTNADEGSERHAFMVTEVSNGNEHVSESQEEEAEETRAGL